MSEKKTEITVGVILTGALLILILGIIWGKDIDIFSHRRYIVVHFNNIYGLERNDPVLIRGIKQGEVDRIFLEPEYVEVRLWVRENVPLYSDLKVSIESRELIGGKQIAIDPGKSSQAADLDRIYTGAISGDLGVLMLQIGEVLSGVDDVLGELRIVLEQERVGRILQNVEEATIQVKQVVAENRQGLRVSVKRLEQILQGFQEDSTMVHIGDVVTQLDTTVSLINEIALQLEKEDGTMGKLLHDRWLYNQLLETSANLDSLITDIKTNPKRYIHFSLF